MYWTFKWWSMLCWWGFSTRFINDLYTCTFYTDNLHQFQGSLHDIQSSSLLAQKIKASLQTFNNPVVLLGLQFQYGTTKLSVSSEDSLGTIYIRFQNGGRLCFANCQNSDCQAKVQNKNKVPKSISLEKLENLFDHIKTLYANIKVLNELFPSYFCEMIIVRNELILTNKKYKILMISICVTYR